MAGQAANRRRRRRSPHAAASGGCGESSGARLPPTQLATTPEDRSITAPRLCARAAARGGMGGRQRPGGRRTWLKFMRLQRLCRQAAAHTGRRRAPSASHASLAAPSEVATKSPAAPQQPWRATRRERERGQARALSPRAAAGATARRRAPLLAIITPSSCGGLLERRVRAVPASGNRPLFYLFRCFQHSHLCSLLRPRRKSATCVQPAIAPRWRG